MFEEAEKRAVGGEDKGGFLGQGGSISFEGSGEGIKVAGLGSWAISRGINGDGFGIGLALNFLGFAVGLGFDLLDIAFAFSENFGGLAFAFRAKAGGDLLTFADHAGVDFGGDCGVVVDAFEADVEEFDAIFFEFRFGGLKDFYFKDGPSEADFGESDTEAGVAAEGIGNGFTIFERADEFDELVFGDGVAGFAAKDIGDSGLGAAFIAEADEILFGVGDLPAGESIDIDVELILGGHIGGRAIPFEDAFFDAIDFLDEGDFPVEAGVGDGVTDLFTELSDNDLIGFEDRVGRGEEEEGDGDEGWQEESAVHLDFWSRGRSGKIWLVFSSRTIFLEIWGRTSWRVSR